MAQAELNRSFSEESKRLRNNVDKKSRSIRTTKPKNKYTETLWEMAARLRAQVPPEEWDKLPTDLAKNVDHYLYGSKKIR